MLSSVEDVVSIVDEAVVLKEPSVNESGEAEERGVREYEQMEDEVEEKTENELREETGEMAPDSGREGDKQGLSLVGSKCADKKKVGASTSFRRGR